MAPILFCNVGWMERYEGLSRGDTIVGGGAYVREHESGFEVCNFSPHRGTLYGFVRAPGQGHTINIDRLGADPQSESIAGVTVVWTATRPGGGSVVVGWYQDATVFRHFQTFGRPPKAQAAAGIDGYCISAPASGATLHPVDARTLEVPRHTKGGMGQSNVWFADGIANRAFVRQVEAAIKGTKAPRAIRARRGQRVDQERKVKVELAAVRATCEHFEDLGYSVVDVSDKNLGWDLEAIASRLRLRIEVKGLSGKQFAVELTPREYMAFSALQQDYRLAVALSALDAPELHICRYSPEQQAWVVEGRRSGTLLIKVREAASIGLG